MYKTTVDSSYSFFETLGTYANVTQKINCRLSFHLYVIYLSCEKIWLPVFAIRAPSPKLFYCWKSDTIICCCK